MKNIPKRIKDLQRLQILSTDLRRLNDICQSKRGVNNMTSSHLSSSKALPPVFIKSETPVELPDVNLKRFKLIDGSSSQENLNEEQKLNNKENKSKQNRNFITHHRYKSVNNRAKEKKQVPVLQKFNKILNFSIEKEIKSIVEHLDKVPQNHK